MAKAVNTAVDVANVPGRLAALEAKMAKVAREATNLRTSLTLWPGSTSNVEKVLRSLLTVIEEIDD